MELDEWSITDFCFLGIDIDTEDSLGAGLFGCYGNAEAYATETPNGNGGWAFNLGRVADGPVTCGNAAADEAHLLQWRFGIDLYGVLHALTFDPFDWGFLSGIDLWDVDFVDDSVLAECWNAHEMQDRFAVAAETRSSITHQSCPLLPNQIKINSRCQYFKIQMRW